MGDVAMCVPVMWSLAYKYKDLEIFFLSRKNFAPMFALFPENVKFIGIDLKNDYKGLAGLNRLFRQIKEMKVDAFADLHNVLRTKYLRFRTFLTGIKNQVINKGRLEKKHLTNKGAVNSKPLKTTISRYQDVFSKLGFQFDLDFKSIFQGKDVPIPAEVSAVTGEKNSQWIGIAPFAAHKGKILPLQTMENVVKSLTEKGLKVFLFGAGSKETAVLEGWQNSCKGAISVAGKLGGLANELILISHLDCMVSMDSANMHLASLVGTRAVSVWGATHPAAGFFGFNQQEDDAVQLPLPCRPCSIYGNKECKLSSKYQCLNDITAEMVVEKILKQK